MKNLRIRIFIFYLSVLLVITGIVPTFATGTKIFSNQKKEGLILDEKTVEKKYPLSKAYLDNELEMSKDSGKKIFILQFEDNKEKECIKELKKIENLEIKYHYDTIFKGVSIKVRTDQISKIREIKGIKNIQENGTFKPQIASAKQMTMVKEAVDYYDGLLSTMSNEEINKRHLDGRGTVVAVIDSGIDIGHESMRIDKDAEKYIKVQPDPGFTKKVPHGFSYVGGGNDLMDKVVDGHGMHCAGIIAGNGENFKGVVPNAQLFAYRIFSDSFYPEEDFRRYEYGGDDSVYHAIDDAVKHGADVISMSIGQAGNGYVGDLYYETVNRAADNGVVIVSAIGNYSSSASDNTYDSNPENHLGLTNTSAMTYYAGIDRMLAVGSTTNITKTTKQIKMNDKLYPYTTLGTKKVNEKIMEDNKGDFGFVFAGHGRESAYKNLQEKNISVKDKVVLVLRDGARIKGSKIVEKIENAAKHGAKGIIVMNAPIAYTRDTYLDYTITSYENDPEMSSIVKNNNIWAISVNGRDGEEIKKLHNKKVNIDFPKEDAVSSLSPDIRVSGFSGWGPNAELEIKPEVVAPGENIYSTMNRNRYGYMSGTSMATPHVAGISAMLIQKVKSLQDKDLFKNMKNSDINKIILMNTSIPIKDYINKNIETSPRRQGAGIVQADRAIKNDVFVTYKQKAAIELKDFKDDIKAFTLRIDNTSNISKIYDINYSDVIGEDVKIENKLALSPEKIQYGEFTDIFKNEDVKVTVPTKIDAQLNGDKSVSIPANSHIELSFVLNTKNIKNHFVEGYIYFTPKNSQDPEISIPYMGYKGDWQEGPIIDKPMWDNDSLFKQTTVVGIYPDSGHGEDIEYKILGVEEEAYQEKKDKYGKILKDEERLKDGYKVDPEKIQFSTGFNALNPKSVTLRLIALREVKDLEVAILNSDKKIVRVISRTKNYRKQINNVIYESEWQRKVFHRPNILFTWDGTLYNPESGEMEYAPNGQYYYRVRAKVKDTDNYEETILPVKVDATSPTSSKLEYTFNQDGTRNVKFNIKDENDIKFVGASLDNKPIDVEKISDDSYIIKDLAINEFTRSHLHIEAMDYANNLMIPIDEDLNNPKKIQDESIVKKNIKDSEEKTYQDIDDVEEIEKKTFGATDYEKMSSEDLNEFAKAFNYGFENYYILTASNEKLREENGNYYFNPDEDSWYSEFDRSTILDEDDYNIILTVYNTKDNIKAYDPIWTKTFEGVSQNIENLDIPVRDGVNILNITAIEKDSNKIMYSRGVLIMIDTKNPELEIDGAMFDSDRKIVYANSNILNVKGSIKDNLDEVYLDINGDNIVTKSKFGDWGNNKTEFEQKINVKDGDIILFKTKDRFQNHKEIRYTVKIDDVKPDIQFDDKNLNKDSILDPVFSDNNKVIEKFIFVNGKPYEFGNKLSDYGKEKFIIELKAVDIAGNVTEKTVSVGVNNSDKNIEGIRLDKDTFTKREIENIKDYIKYPENIEILNVSEIDLEKSTQEITVTVKNELGIKKEFKFTVKISDTTLEELSKIETKKNFLPEELNREKLIGKLPTGVSIVVEPIDATKPGSKDIIVNFIKDNSIIESKIYNVNILPQLEAKLIKTRFSKDEIRDIKNVIKKNNNFKYEFISPIPDKTGEQEIKIKISDDFGHLKEVTFRVNIYEKEKTNVDTDTKKDPSLDYFNKGKNNLNNRIYIENSNKQYNPVTERKDNTKISEDEILLKDIYDNWAKDYILRAMKDKIVSGYPDGTFRPQNSTTRSEFVSLANRMFKYTKAVKSKFNDVNGNVWYRNDLECLLANNLIYGDENNNFNPQKDITREEIISIFIRYIEKENPEIFKELRKMTFIDKDEISTWALKDVEKAYSIGLVKGDDKNMIRSKDKATRAEVVVMIYNLKNIIK